MARILTMGFETQTQATTKQYHGESDNSAAGGNWNALQVGTTTIDTTNQRSGAACLSMAQGAANHLQCETDIRLDVDFYARCYFKFTDASPATLATIIRVVANAINIAEVRLATNGTLGLFEANGTQVGSSSAALADNTWYRLELQWMIPTAGNGNLRLVVDGIEVAGALGSVDLNNSAATPVIRFGNPAGGTAGVTTFLDDIAVNDSTGTAQNSWPGPGKVVILKPISDAGTGTGWEGPQTTGSDTTNLFDNVDNYPPTANAAPSAANDLDANAGKWVFNIANLGSASNFDVNTQNYSTAGITANDTINVVQGYIRATSDSTTGTNNGALRLVSNPADSADTTVNLELIAAGVAEPTGWKTFKTPPQYGPVVTLGTSPVVRGIRTQTGITRSHAIDQMGVIVEYTPSELPNIEVQTASV